MKARLYTDDSGRMLDMGGASVVLCDPALIPPRPWYLRLWHRAKRTARTLWWRARY